MTQYKGFSTVSSQSQKKFVLTNQDLIKQDLMNTLMTRRGQRIMSPLIGCIVWEKLFDNLAQSDSTDIASNISSIINTDPRVVLLSVDVTPTNNSITVTIVIQYVGTDETDQLILNYNNSL